MRDSNRLSYLFHQDFELDPWLLWASNQVAQGLLTMPYSLVLLGVWNGIIFELLCGLTACWMAYIIHIIYLLYKTESMNHCIRIRVNRRRQLGDDTSEAPISLEWYEVLKKFSPNEWWANIGRVFNCSFLLLGSVIQVISCASNMYYFIEDLDKKTWAHIISILSATVLFLPSFRHCRAWSFLSLLIVMCIAVYLTVASLIHTEIESVQEKVGAPRTMVHGRFLVGLSNILYTFGRPNFPVEMMHKRQPHEHKKQPHEQRKFIAGYLFAILFTLVPAVSLYKRFGDVLLTNANVLALLPRNFFRDAAAVLMTFHHLITFWAMCSPLFSACEEAFENYLHFLNGEKKAVRLLILAVIYNLAIGFPYFGLINSAVGSLVAGPTVYIIPTLLFIYTFWHSPQRSRREVQPLREWQVMYSVHWILALGAIMVSLFGSFAHVINIILEIKYSGTFPECYQCPPFAK